MITYFVDTTTNPASPRLMRQINGQRAPNAVAFELEAFRLTYDLADGVTNPVGVRMDAADLGGGAARARRSACSPNQIRKANVTLAIRSEQRNADAGVLPQHALHAGGAAQPGVRGSLPARRDDLLSGRTLHAERSHDQRP